MRNCGFAGVASTANCGLAAATMRSNSVPTEKGAGEAAAGAAVTAGAGAGTGAASLRTTARGSGGFDPEVRPKKAPTPIATSASSPPAIHQAVPERRVVDAAGAPPVAFGATAARDGTGSRKVTGRVSYGGASCDTSPIAWRSAAIEG